MELLEAFFELNRQQIEKILEYREGGGLERVVETSAKLNQLTEAQINILQMMINREVLDKKGE